MYTIKCKDPGGNDFDVFVPGAEVLTVVDVVSADAGLWFSDLDTLQNSLPEYNPKYTLIANNQNYTRLINSGFENVIDAEAYPVGSKWTFENGSYIEKISDVNFRLKYEDGTEIRDQGVIWGTFGIGSGSQPSAWNYVGFFLPFYPSELAQEITDTAQAAFEAAGQSTWAGFTYNSITTLGYWRPDEYPPSYRLSNNYLTRTSLMVPGVNILQVLQFEHLDIYDKWFEGITIEGDPYANNPDGPSSTGGGDGEAEGDNEPVDIPSLPGISATDTGFITIYNPSLAELNNLASYMWSGPFDLDTFKKIFADPMDAVLGLSIVPCVIPNGGSQSVKVGNIDTGITMTKAATQFVEIDCGSKRIKKKWGSYLDYDPYTKAEVYLPFIGIHALSVDDIMNKTLRIVYHIDILSGACTAYLKCGDSVLYQYTGSCACNVPITGNDWSNTLQGAIHIAAAIGSMAGTAGVSALGIGSIAATAVNTAKPSIEKSGANGGSGALMDTMHPYIILSRPRACSPDNQNKYLGYPSFITSKIGSLSGYTEIDNVRLSGMSATDAEKEEIQRLLEGGVIV